MQDSCQVQAPALMDIRKLIDAFYAQKEVISTTIEFPGYYIEFGNQTEDHHSHHNSAL